MQRRFGTRTPKDGPTKERGTGRARHCRCVAEAIRMILGMRQGRVMEVDGETLLRRSDPQRWFVLARWCGEDIVDRGAALRHQGRHASWSRRRRKHRRGL